MVQSTVSSGMSGRLVHELEYHYSDDAFGDWPDANITIRYYQKMNRFAKYKLANNSNFTVLHLRSFINVLIDDMKLTLNNYLNVSERRQFAIY